MNNDISSDLSHIGSTHIQDPSFVQALQVSHRIASGLDKELNGLSTGHIHDLVRGLASDLDHDLNLAFNHAREIDAALGKLFELSPTQDSDLRSQQNFARARARYLLHQVIFTRNLELKLITPFAHREEIHGESIADRGESPMGVAVAPLAGELISLAMCVLPVAHRERYIEELHAELWDLAAAKATRSMQVFYAVQQFSRVWQLRRSLKAPDRSWIGLMHQAACWVLASQALTWGLIGLITILALFDVIVQQGPGSAVLALPALVGFHTGVEWLRKRWGVVVRPRKRPKDE